MTTQTPLVSVLMTVYNREQYVAEAIESVIASNYKVWELIIVDDQSADNSVNIARVYAEKDPRISVYVNEKNLGDYPNRNRAASYAKGKYIKYLDSDDVMYPHCLQVMVDAMEQFPEAGFGLSAVPEPERPYPVCITPKQAYLEHFGRYGHFNRAPGSGIIRLDVFNELGGFSGKRMIGDNEFWFKIGRYYPLVKFPRDLSWDRKHIGQESKSKYAKSYGKLRKEVTGNALDHRDSPLSKTEKRFVQHTIRWRSFKSFFINVGLKLKSHKVLRTKKIAHKDKIPTDSHSFKKHL